LEVAGTEDWQDSNGEQFIKEAMMARFVVRKEGPAGRGTAQPR